MTPVDYAMLGIIAASSLLGAFRGLLRELISLATLLLALWAAAFYSDLVSPFLGGAVAAEPLRTWVARGLTFLAVMLLGTIVGAVLNNFVRMSIFSGVDRLMGVVFGFIRGALILGVLVMLARLVRLDGEAWWAQSALMPYASLIGDVIKRIVGGG